MRDRHQNISTSAAAAAAEDAAMGSSLQGEDFSLEVQVQSQFRLLWAVFQSHSTAEDEVIWPALKEKARSSGGKVGRTGGGGLLLAFGVRVVCAHCSCIVDEASVCTPGWLSSSCCRGFSCAEASFDSRSLCVLFIHMGPSLNLGFLNTDD